MSIVEALFKTERMGEGMERRKKDADVILCAWKRNHEVEMCSGQRKGAREIASISISIGCGRSDISIDHGHPHDDLEQRETGQPDITLVPELASLKEESFPSSTYLRTQSRLARDSKESVVSCHRGSYLYLPQSRFRDESCLTGITFQGLVVAAMFLAGAVHAGILHRGGLLRLASSDVKIWDYDQDIREDEEEEDRELSKKSKVERQRERITEVRKSVTAKDSSKKENTKITEDMLEQKRKIAEFNRLKNEAAEKERTAKAEEEKKRVFAEQEEAKKILKQKLLDRQKAEEEMERRRMEKLEERKKEEEEKTRLRKETLEKLNASEPMLTTLSTEGSEQKSSRLIYESANSINFEVEAALMMKRVTEEGEDTPVVEINLLPTCSEGLGNAKMKWKESGLMEQLKSIHSEETLNRIALAAAVEATESNMGSLRMQELMGEGPLADGRLDEPTLMYVGRLAQVAAYYSWRETLTRTVNDNFDDIVSNDRIIEVNLKGPSIAWPTGGPLEPKIGSEDEKERLYNLVVDSASLITDSADEIRASKLLMRAYNIAHAYYDSCKVMNVTIPYSVSLLAALFVELIHEKLKLKEAESNAKAQSQRDSGRKLTATYTTKYFEEQKIKILARTKSLVKQLIDNNKDLANVDDSDTRIEIWRNSIRKGGWLDITLGGSGIHPLITLITNILDLSEEKNGISSEDVSFLESQSEKKARYANLRDETAPVAERLYTMKNVSQTLKQTGALDEARKMLESAIELKRSVLEGRYDSDQMAPWFLADYFELAELLMEKEDWYKEALCCGEMLMRACSASMQELEDKNRINELCAIAIIVSYFVKEMLEEIRQTVVMNDSLFDSVMKMEESMKNIRIFAASKQSLLSEHDRSVVSDLIEDSSTLGKVSSSLRGQRFLIEAMKRKDSDSNNLYH